MSIEKVLIIDDELIIRNFLAETLRRKHYEVMTAESGHSALKLIEHHAFDLVITDMKMPDMSGLEVIKKTKELSPSTLVIVMTAFGSIENAVEAMRLGAFNYLVKPFSPDAIEAMIEKADQHASIIQENSYLRQHAAPGGSNPINRIVYESPIMKKIMEEVKKIAKSHSSVLISGESGTGKEVVAHAIHMNSLRAEQPFIRVNCAAIPDTLIESEFFGHEKGAFTGAVNKRIGRFELANEGTLLLDEISEIPLALQSKLLRVVQEQELERVGGTKLVKVDVRLISTSNQDMKKAIQEKTFREDLYYRLNVVPVFLPPLRDRREDIVPLAVYFIEKYCLENHKLKKTMTPEAEKKLLSYDWPGNIRELGNIIERSIVMDDEAVIDAEHLLLEIVPKETKKTKELSPSPTQIHLPVGIKLEELEKQFIEQTLQAQNQNKTKTAEVLGISIRTLRNKLNEFKMTEET